MCKNGRIWRWVDHAYGSALNFKNVFCTFVIYIFASELNTKATYSFTQVIIKTIILENPSIFFSQMIKDMKKGINERRDCQERCTTELHGGDYHPT